MRKDVPMTALSVRLELRGGTPVLVYDRGGCHPASFAEVAMWTEIERLRAEAAVCPKCGASGGEYSTCTVCGTSKVPQTTDYERLLRTYMQAVIDADDIVAKPIWLELQGSLKAADHDKDLLQKIYDELESMRRY